MTQQGDWVSALRGIIQQMTATEVTELEVRQGHLRVRLRRQPGEAPARAPQVGADEPAAPDHQYLHRVVAPLTGIFYAAPSPSSRPYVALGDWVEQNTPVGLIETMKVFNEVSAECRGRVMSVLAQQGQMVHAGDAILLVDTAAAPDRAGEVAP